MTIDRRQFLRTSAALGITALMPASRLRAQPAPHARLGDLPAAFDREFGSGRPDSGFVVYEGVEDGTADYWVAFNNSNQAEMVEIDFSPLPDGGLPSATDIIGWSRFLRDDAEKDGMMMLLGSLNAARHSFHIQPWFSSSLSTDLGRSGRVIVVDEDDGDSSVAEVGNWDILRTHVAMETWNVYEIPRTGTLPGPASMIDAWNERFTLQTTWDKLAYMVQEPPLPGFWLVSAYTMEVDIMFDNPISMRDSSDLVGSMLPESGNEVWTSFMPASPTSTYGLRLNGFNLGLQGWPTYVLRYVTGDEENGTVDRIILRTENPDQFGRPA